MENEMLTAFKIYCKDMVIGATVGASIGGAAGAAAAKVGLNQVCNSTGKTPSCVHLVNQTTPDSVQMGAATGAAVGFGIGMFLYPPYRALARCVWERNDRPDLA